MDKGMPNEVLIFVLHKWELCGSTILVNVLEINGEYGMFIEYKKLRQLQEKISA